MAALLAVLVAAAPAQAERIADLRLTASDGVPLHATTIGNRFNGALR